MKAHFRSLWDTLPSATLKNAREQLKAALSLRLSTQYFTCN